MSENTQVILPPPSREEDAVVDRFITASREIAPTVQVSLAKRILQPGSNRVVCLAAHTTVPLNEDELASVSDLALRLSDGTNVRLSVSFFNDDSGTVFGDAYAVPFTRNIYDPNRYSMQTGGDSKLGLVLCAMATIVLASYYAYKNCNFNPLAPAKLPAPTAPLLQAKPPSASARSINKSAANPSAEHSTKAHFPKEDFLPEAPMRSHARNARSGRHINVEEPAAPYPAGKHSSRSKPDLMLVPPPPPFAVPLGSSGMPFAPSYDLRNLDGSNQLGVSPAKADRPAKSDTPQRASSAKATTPAQSAAVSKAPQKVELDPDVLLPGAAPARSYTDFTATKPQRPLPADMSSSAPTSAAIEQYRGSALQTAPLPGDSVQLERIVPPQQQ